jgi:hypothetical protein
MIALGRQRIPQEMKGGPMRDARICGVNMTESDRQEADIAGSCETRKFPACAKNGLLG